MDEENKVEGTQTTPEAAPASNAPQPKNANMTVCKSCGTQIAKSAKTCPNCGAKNKKAGKKILIFAVIAVVLIIIFAAAGGKDDAPTPAAAPEQAVQNADSGKKAAEKQTEKTTAAPEYVTASIESLFDDLKGNAYNAQQKWKDQYVTITGGKVATIDASGQYFSIESSSDEYWLSTIHVSIPKDIRDEVMSSISSGANVTVSGKISEVGELMGYTIDAYEVNY